MAGLLTRSNPPPAQSRYLQTEPLGLAGVFAMRKLIALALEGGPLFLGELQRALSEGDAVLPVDQRLSGRSRQRLLEAMRPAVLVTSNGERHELPDPLPVEEGDVLVMATSGTTARPKGVVLTAEAVSASASASNRRLEVDPEEDRWWACLPLSHIGGLSVVLRALAADVAFDIAPRFTKEGALSALESGATLTSLVPTALGRLGREAAHSFRHILLGGQAPPGELGDNVITTYGLTETGSGVVYDGEPLEGVEVRIDAVGDEILLRCPMLLRCYRDGTDPRDPEGFFHTGDAGGFDDNGRLVVHGRLSEMIISGGENLWPAAIEQVLEKHPLVREAAVAGRRDPEWGERVTAFVVPAGELEAASLLAELRELVREELASYAAPRELVLVAALPRTAIGKINRADLSSLDGPSVRS
jgi:O-succinylbenzoic acid--CoA ligase